MMELKGKIPVEVTKLISDLTGVSPDTTRVYKVFAKIFWGFVDKSPQDVTVEDVTNFLNWGEKKRGWSLTTIKYYAGLSQRFLAEFKDENFIKELKKVIRRLPKKRTHESLYEGNYIPGDRIDDFINTAENEEYAVLYTMILKWGLRISEALNQRIEELNPKALKVIVRGKGQGSEHKVRNVWVDFPSIQRVLAFAGCTSQEISGSQPIRKRGKIIQHLNERTVQNEWKRTAKKIGLRNWKKLTPHDGRHSYAIDFLIRRKKEGMAALVLLKNQLGHTNINTTMIYLDIAGTEAREIFDAGLTQP